MSSTHAGSGRAAAGRSMRVARIDPENRVAILHQRKADGTLWGTSGRRILRRRAEGEWTEIARLPFVWRRDALALTRPLARALRADKGNLFVNSRSQLLAIRSSTVYRLEDGSLPAVLFHIQGDSVLHGGLCEDLEGWTYFGEYFMNAGRGDVRIWRVDPELRTWETAHTFDPGTVRHVHGVYRDPFDAEALWVTTGDKDGECFFYRTRDRFRSLERFGEGDQQWRAVRLFFTPAHICWLTDSQTEVNHAYRMERDTGVIEYGASFQAPAWYGTTTEDGVHVAFTTVEPGPAVQRPSAAVLVSDDAFHWQEIHQFEKDFWRPMKVFKYGVISCPAGPMSIRELFISGEGLKGLDGISARLEIVRERG